MSLVINSQSIQKDWTFTEDEWVMRGTSQQNAVNSAIKNFNCQIFKLVGEQGEESEQYVGDANGYLSGEELKTNINNVPTRELAEVSQVIEDLITALCS